MGRARYVREPVRSASAEQQSGTIGRRREDIHIFPYHLYIGCKPRDPHQALRRVHGSAHCPHPIGAHVPMVIRHTTLRKVWSTMSTDLAKSMTRFRGELLQTPPHPISASPSPHPTPRHRTAASPCAPSPTGKRTLHFPYVMAQTERYLPGFGARFVSRPDIVDFVMMGNNLHQLCLGLHRIRVRSIEHRRMFMCLNDDIEHPSVEHARLLGAFFEGGNIDCSVYKSR